MHVLEHWQKERPQPSATAVDITGVLLGVHIYLEYAHYYK